VPLRYLANLFAAGNEEVVTAVYRKLIAVRLAMRARTVHDLDEADIKQALADAETTPEEVEAIFRLTALPTFDERFVVPPLAREQAIEALGDPFARKREGGFGFRRPPVRGW
jgi:nitrate reductase beta subunit